MHPGNTQNGVNKETAEYWLNRFILEDGMPITILESVNLKNFVEKLYPNFKLPTRAHLTKVILPEIYDVNKLELQKNLTESNFVCSTVDSWTSAGNDSSRNSDSLS